MTVLQAVEDRLYYMQDARQYVGNCVYWWRKEGSGYTCELSEAHVFTHDEAMRQHRQRPDVDIPWPKDIVDAAASLHVDVQRLDRKSNEGFLREQSEG